MTKKIDKNSFIQRYLEKTNCSHWKLEENNENVKEKGNPIIIGLPSLEFLYEIQKSISFKLANKYKYVASNKKENSEEYEDDDDDYSDDDEEDDDDDDDDDDEDNYYSKIGNEESNVIEKEGNDNTEELEKRKRKKVSKRKTHSKSIIRSISSGLLKMNSKNSLNRFPLSQPCLKPEIYNERCGPEVLMSLGYLQLTIDLKPINNNHKIQSSTNNNPIDSIILYYPKISPWNPNSKVH
ncbi:hypothetical protein ACTA71_006362 [Dictyostelium dimigraforme]